MKRFPNYPARAHKTGQARIKLFGRSVYLGLHGSPESWAEYQRLLDLWRRGELPEHARAETVAANPRTVADLLAAYMRWAERRHAGKRQLEILVDALAPLVRLCGHLPCGDLRKPVLRRALEDAAAGRWLTPGEREEHRRNGRRLLWGRRYANRNLRRWLAALRWCEGEELVPAGAFRLLEDTEPLREGEAHETEEVVPVPEEDYARTLPHLGPIPRALAETLALTGARPGELFRLTPGMLNRSGVVELAKGYRVTLGEVWAYQPQRHKTSWRGHRRVILFGPQAQAVLGPLLEGRGGSTPVFCPREASRRDPGSPGGPRANYDRHSLGQAIARACRRAGVPRWSAYRLRHLAASRLCSQFGPEVARVVLGHRDLRLLDTYVMPDLERAARALGEAG